MEILWNCTNTPLWHVVKFISHTKRFNLLFDDSMSQGQGCTDIKLSLCLKTGLNLQIFTIYIHWVWKSISLPPHNAKQECRLLLPLPKSRFYHFSSFCSAGNFLKKIKAVHYIIKLYIHKHLKQSTNISWIKCSKYYMQNCSKNVSRSSRILQSI